MDVSEWVAAAIALLSLIGAVVFGFRSTRASERSAKAAEVSAASASRSVELATSQLKSSASAQAESLQLGHEQLETTIRVHQDSLQPYLWVDLRAREDGNGLMVLVLGNSGPTVATNVRVEFQPALSQIVPPGKVAAANHIENRLSDGLSSVAPGRVFTWGLGMASDFFADEEFDTAPAAIFEITITANGPNGPIPPSSYSIGLEDLKHQALRPEGLGLLNLR